MRLRDAAGLIAVTALIAPALALATPPTPVGMIMQGPTVPVGEDTPTHARDTGTVTGSPVGSGRIVINYSLKPARSTATVVWTVRNASGSVRGTVKAYFTTTNTEIIVSGAGSVTGGTGRYAGIMSKPLQFLARHARGDTKGAVVFRGTGSIPPAR